MRGTGVDDSVVLQTVCHQLTKQSFTKAVSGTLFGSATPMYSNDHFVCGPVAPISRHLVTGSTARRPGGFHWLAANARLRHSHHRSLHGLRRGRHSSSTTSKENSFQDILSSWPAGTDGLVDRPIA